MDSEGHQYVLMKEISDHRKDDSAVSMANGWITKPNGTKCHKITTHTWQLLVEWKEGGEDWLPLKDLKESYPVEVAEYAKAHKFSEELAFAWWISDILQRRNRIITKVKSGLGSPSTNLE